MRLQNGPRVSRHTRIHQMPYSPLSILNATWLMAIKEGTPHTPPSNRLIRNAKPKLQPIQYNAVLASRMLNTLMFKWTVIITHMPH